MRFRATRALVRQHQHGVVRRAGASLDLAAAGAMRTVEAGANYAILTLDRADLKLHRRRVCTQCISIAR